MAGSGRPHLTKEQRLPRSYKDTEKVLKSLKACEGNINTILHKSRFRGSYFQKVYALTINVLKNNDVLEHIIEETGLLEKIPYMRKELAAIMVYEITIGNGKLPGKSKPVLSIKEYMQDIMTSYQNLKYGALSSNPKSNTGFHLLPRYARIHTLITSVSKVLEDLEFHGYEQINYSEDISENKYVELVQNLQSQTFLIDYHFKDLLVFSYGENLSNWQLYLDGHIFLQDKSSYIPVHVLDPEPGSFVLDACAAPGMKSVHLSAKMQNEGLLHTCERDPGRFKTLQNMLEHGKVTISKSICQDFKLIDPYEELYSTVDYILLDPSCSGSGMVNRMDKVTDTEESKSKARLQNLAGFQIVLLKHALRFPSVKRIVYSTCSVNEEENEYVVHEALNAFNQEFKLVQVMPDWAVRGLESYEYGKMCLRAYPDKNLTNGFFVAMFERIKIDSVESFTTGNLNNSLNKSSCSSSVVNSKKNKIISNSNKDSYELCESSNAENTNSSINIESFHMPKKEKKHGEIGSVDCDVPKFKSQNFYSSADVIKSSYIHKKGKKHAKKSSGDCEISKSQNIDSFTDQSSDMYKKERNHTENDTHDHELPELKSQNSVSSVAVTKSVKKHKKKGKHAAKDTEGYEVYKSQNIDSSTDLPSSHMHKKKRKHAKNYAQDHKVHELKSQNSDSSADVMKFFQKSRKKGKHGENDTNGCKEPQLKSQNSDSSANVAKSFRKHKRKENFEVSEYQNIDSSAKLQSPQVHKKKRKHSENDIGDYEISELKPQSSECFTGVKSCKHSKKKKHAESVFTN